MFFPEDFYQFKTSLVNEVHDYEINSWIQKGMEELKKNPDLTHYSIATGDSKVIILKFEYNNSIAYEIIVAKNYWSKYISK